MRKLLSKRNIIIFEVVIVIITAVSVFAAVKYEEQYFAPSQKLSDVCPDLLSDGTSERVRHINTHVSLNGESESTMHKDIKQGIKDLEISLNPVSNDKSFEREKTNFIAFEELIDDFSTHSYSEIIYFNKDFTEVWVYDEGIPTYTYKVKEPEKAREICNVNFTIIGNSE